VDSDGFSSRNSHAVFTYKGKVFVFGGKDSESDAEFNDLFLFDQETNTFKEIHFLKDELVPAKRNSH